MYSRPLPNKMNKRPHEEFETERPRKSPFGVVKIEGDEPVETKVFRFRVLLPNGTTIELKIRESHNEMPIKEFIDRVRKEHDIVLKQRKSQESKRRINWKYEDLHFTDAHANKIRIEVNFRDFVPNKWYFLWLHDGSPQPDAYENMWDLTPDTDLLKELPDDYTFETALADLIDNSLQALWSNGVGERRLIRVELLPNKLSIFDSGPGMDGSDGNLVKWGKMGASLHRSVRGRAVGGEPPYLMPFFGMFGYGGPVATMCLGRRAVVSSKTKNCKKVFTLHLEREALMSASSSKNCWTTKGGVRDPFEDEKKKSPHGSFTKVEIFEPKVKDMDTKHIRCKLKDIYFPYIQCDEVSGKTSRPIEFQVNGKDLAGIQGGEVATTNLHSCHGPDFVLQLRFSISQDSSPMVGQSQRVYLEANARLKCVYFPIVQGEESIKKIIDKLDADGCGIRESYESFSRVCVRRLGRLLPDTRWALLPFMEPKLRVGEKAHILKRCCSRVKCFIDTDSGFNPTPCKTDLAHHHPYTKALKSFGNGTPENEKEVKVEIFRDGKILTVNQLEKQYNDWVSEMHERYDEEIEGGLDQPIIIVVSSKIKKLGISSDVLRVHKKIQRKGAYYFAGQKIKVFKGACAGCHKNNVYATLEYIILAGLPGDNCGEARLICRPLGLPKERGCHLMVENGNNTIDFRDSLVLPIRVIDSEKCIPVDDIEWEKKLEAYNQKLQSAIHLLSQIDCQELGIEGGWPTSVKAGDAPPENIVAVIRPKSFDSENSSQRWDPKFIVRDNLQMTLKITSEKSGEECGLIYSMRLSPSPHKGFHGLYLFPLRTKCPLLFQEAGFFSFSFSMNGQEDIRVEKVVQVQTSAKVGKWRILNHKKDELYTVRVGTCFMPLSVACYDRYNNSILFTSVPKLTIKLSSSGIILAHARNEKVDMAPDKSTIVIKEFFVRSSNLDDIRPNYEATLDISTLDEAFSVALPCRVLPGTPQRITFHPPNLRKQLIPGQVIEKLALEVFDDYGNHVKEDESIVLIVDGFSFQEGSGIVGGVGTNCLKKVDAKGYVDLSNILKVSKEKGKVSLSVISNKQSIFKLWFQIEIRETSAVPKTLQSSPSLKVSEVTHETVTPQSINQFVLPINSSPASKTPKLEPIDVQSENSGTLRSHDSSSQDLGKLAASTSICLKELEDDLMKSGITMFDHQRNLERLNSSRPHIQQQISDLQATMDRVLAGGSSTCSKESVLKQIESKPHSAAAVICKTLEEIPFELRPPNIIGVVALLGAVHSIELSRMLAQYLGEDQMLAIVCKDYAAANYFETTTLPKFAEFGHSINGGCLALCLEDIRPRFKNPSSDPEQLLPLEMPTLPKGNAVQGFLGYAVNLINIEANNLQWRSKSGHGLRETLFYRLLGGLQVYKDQKCMMKAQSCIEDGAVSLDGGIMRGNGLVSLGNWKPKILFPVITKTGLQKLELLEEKKLELIQTDKLIDEENNSYKRAMKKFRISQDKYNNCISQNTSFPAFGSS